MTPDGVTPNDLLLVVSTATFVTALFAAVYSARTFWLKSGIDIRGNYGLVSSVASNEKYVGSITLENLKDRPVVIFKIFLEVSHGYYIKIDDFEDDPLILDGFKAFKKTYDPIDFYSGGMNQVRMGNLLGEDHVRHRLILSTTQGKYVVGKRVVHWDPVSKYFRNHLTAILRPMRTVYEGRAYGSGTKYIVKIESENRDDEIIPIYPHDHRVKKFKSFQLTRNSLESKEALERFLVERAVAGDLSCSDVSVLDAEEWRQGVWEKHKQNVFEARPRGWFVYNVLGFLITKWEDMKLKWENWRRGKD